MTELEACKERLLRIEAKWMESRREVERLTIALMTNTGHTECITHGRESMYACARCYADEANRLETLKRGIGTLYLLKDRLSRRGTDEEIRG